MKVKFHHDHLKYGNEIGDAHVWSVQRGRFYACLVRYHGYYGQRNTITYGVKWSTSDCSLCGNHIRSEDCKHPWNLSFIDWPHSEKQELLSALKPFTK